MYSGSNVEELQAILPAQKCRMIHGSLEVGCIREEEEQVESCLKSATYFEAEPGLEQQDIQHVENAGRRYQPQE